VADPEYARLNTGVSITRGNSGNGELPTRGSEQAENKRDVGQITDARTRRPPFGNDHLPRLPYGRSGKLNPVTTMRVE
jgi:hypothetical protein